MSQGLQNFTDHGTTIKVIGYSNPAQLEVTRCRFEAQAVVANKGGLVLELIAGLESNTRSDGVLPPPKLKGASGGPAVLPTGEVRSYQSLESILSLSSGRLIAEHKE